MKILFISSLLLFKDTRFGGSKRLYYFARYLQQSHDLTLICFDGCKERAYWKADCGEFAKFLLLDDAQRPILSKLFHVPDDTSHHLAANLPALKAALSREQFDCALLAFPYALTFTSKIPVPTGRIVYLEDDLTLEQIRILARTSRNPLRKIWKLLRYRQELHFYRKQLRKIGSFIAISSQEKSVVQRYFPWLNIQVVKYGIDLQEYPLLPPFGGGSVTLGYIGNYNHRPNYISVAWFLAEIYPLLQTELPAIRIVLAGQNCPHDLMSRYPGDGIVWQENVPVLEDFYRQIFIFVNPIVHGRGLRTKLIEAAALGRPIISTTLGAEGLDDLSMEIGDTPEAFVALVKKLAGDAALRNSMVHRNRQIVEQHYALSAVTERLIDALSNTEPRA